MSLLGRLLKNRRSGEAQAAWNRPNLHAAEPLELSSRSFDQGGTIPQDHWAKYIGGRNLSPQLAWSPPPTATAQLLLVVEDTDVPQARPAVHCMALIDPAVRELAPGALARRQPGTGVTLLRSVIGRGYQGPAPIKGHGPHHYTFQLFALAAPLGATPGGAAAERARPRALLSSVGTPVLARGRITGTVER
ncbi:YbhB/YbcL family Raf kinase inhibitor-like protein [Streptacidiphilus sp. PB12-B1b]|uniref:YbhB/YbcL family Raf kinase inhibitor-like protein n=1 Tax=Streptacidiphilus sp. PB12-B1b TaxID=2705012 RepID=UPI0015FDDC04|nr:YbhB/YbcL family Raf kinase inhibitor-like protein [Streptacidiphilus sp. PB12-B1b]QMU79850.1 YbhB/YbcL family Raf kinase inhibitor-like protein [Streptacidiphilus sp. PB12-B1b]